MFKSVVVSAMSDVDIALWVLLGKKHESPIYKLLDNFLKPKEAHLDIYTFQLLEFLERFQDS